uniref:Uncharacterized protein n=1 Tax=Candidatus Kentrum sp. FM TaxID=2126340 RepID=A0A450S128_9GAMM|nr:MAG: hypothetical protein BECKFM1743C_GA0114222_100242 [Candidatus Kentron sp. FM]VFJ45475.1 MAG: hypothetical protein BECKFM1743A_GA0114220_1002414 [Candidatus Kentron sp. FM]
MDKKSPFLAQFLARMSAFERENSTFLLVFHPVSADVIFWECTRPYVRGERRGEPKFASEHSPIHVDFRGVIASIGHQPGARRVSIIFVCFYYRRLMFSWFLWALGRQRHVVVR